MPYEMLRENVLFAANKAWHELLTHADTYVIKKVEARDTFDQLRYKMKKIFSNDRAPENTLKIVRKRDVTKPWYQSSSKHKKVYVRIEAFVRPLGSADPEYEVPNIWAEVEERPVPLAKLSVYVQAKHFYDDKATQDCPRFTAQVREKFGAYPENAHISGWRPTKALDTGWLKKFYKNNRKITKWDEALSNLIYFDNLVPELVEWYEKHWNSDPRNAEGT